MAYKNVHKCIVIVKPLMDVSFMHLKTWKVNPVEIVSVIITISY